MTYYTWDGEEHKGTVEQSYDDDEIVRFRNGEPAVLRDDADYLIEKRENNKKLDLLRDAIDAVDDALSDVAYTHKQSLELQRQVLKTREGLAAIKEMFRCGWRL